MLEQEVKLYSALPALTPWSCKGGVAKLLRTVRAMFGMSPTHLLINVRDARKPFHFSISTQTHRQTSPDETPLGEELR